MPPSSWSSRAATTPPAGSASVIDAMGRKTNYDYYADNLLKTTTRSDRPDGRSGRRQAVYDNAGHLTKATRAGGTITTYTYDAAGNIVSQTLDPSGLNRVTTTTYTPRTGRRPPRPARRPRGAPRRSP